MTGLPNPSPFEVALEADFVARSKTNEAQAAAFDRFASLRLPNRRVEGWKWTDMNIALRGLEPGEAAAPEVIAPSLFAAMNPLEFRIVNGKVSLPDEPMPEGLRYGVMDPVGTIPELEVHPIATLNVAMTRKAMGLEVMEGVDLKRPVLIRHIVSGAGFSFAQTMLRISPGAKLRLIETYEGDGAGFYSHLCHMIVRDGAAFSRTLLQEADAGVVHGICAGKIDGGARFGQASLSTGGRLSRHETHLHFWDQGSSASVNSAALLWGERHSDFTTETQFRAPGCTVRQTHKGVARDRGRNVFQGKFHVFREGQKTDAQMAANALLLSDGAEANHKPELEIYADDVECAHGSTVGALDEDALFYLRQRGLNEQQARALLVEAFVGEVVESIEDEALREIFAARVTEWLAKA